MITYPRNTDAKYVIYNTATQQIIKRNADYPRADGAEISGLDPDLVYLEQKDTLILPDYDPRYFVKVTTETPKVDDGDWEIKETTQKRDIEQIQASIENAEAEANERLLPFNKQMKALVLGQAVLFRMLDSQNLNSKEQAIRDECIALGVKVWKNDANLRKKINDIAKDNEPDIDEGWERS